MDTVLFKLKNAVLDRFSTIRVVLILLFVLSGLWTCFTYDELSYKEQNVRVSSYIHSGSYTYTAPVTLPNPIYPVGSALGMRKAAYFFAVSPTLDMSFTYGLTASGRADLNVKRETVVIVTSNGSVGEKMTSNGTFGDEKQIFWQKKYPLKSEGPVRMRGGEALVYDFSLNVSEIQERIKGIQDQLQYPEAATVELVTYVTYEGKINGRDISGVKEFPVLLKISSSYYQMPERLDFSDRVDAYNTCKVPVTPPLSELAVPLASLLLSMGLIVLVLIFRRQGKVDPSDIEKMELERKHSQFAEWISSGKLPEEAGALMKVEITSLQGLVDAAADMNARVIHDAGASIYFIIHNGTIYLFHDPLSGGTAS